MLHSSAAFQSQFGSSVALGQIPFSCLVMKITSNLWAKEILQLTYCNTILIRVSVTSLLIQTNKSVFSITLERDYDHRPHSLLWFLNGAKLFAVCCPAILGGRSGLKLCWVGYLVNETGSWWTFWQIGVLFGWHYHIYPAKNSNELCQEPSTKVTERTAAFRRMTSLCLLRQKRFSSLQTSDWGNSTSKVRM